LVALPFPNDKHTHHSILTLPLVQSNPDSGRNAALCMVGHPLYFVQSFTVYAERYYHLEEAVIMSINIRKMPLLLLFAVLLLLPALSQSPAADAQGNNRLNLPLAFITGKIGQQTSVLGGELGATEITASAYRAAQGGVSWTRYNQYNWWKVERYRGDRYWEGEAVAETRLAQMSAAGLTPIMVIHGTPGWAQEVQGSFCGPIAEEDLDAFGNFMFDLVTRFSKPPYNVQYYELYNEPDIAPDLVGDYSPFGCWGDATDSQYYGGAYFGEMLAAAYPRIKQANPNAQVLIGGLLLECDYTHTYTPARDCSSSKFLKGLLTTGDESFDIISYHGYPLRSADRVDWERRYYLWQHRGGVVLGKLDFIRSEFAASGVPMKPVLLTEAGLLCWQSGGCDDYPTELAELQADQANYAMRLYPRTQANGIMGALWYTYSGPGWRDSGILDENQNPRPAFYTFKMLGRALSSATHVGTISEDGGNLEGYSFVKGNTTYIFVWSNNTNVYNYSFPAGGRLFNMYGNEVPAPTNGQLGVSFEPVMIQVGP
jgi:hypothetical protein